MVVTKYLLLTFEALSVQVINWFVNDSFVVHGDMRSHTRVFITLGKGYVYGTSVGQKFNTKILAEAEIL